MTYKYDAVKAAQAIKDEFVSLDNDIWATIRGVSRLTGVSHANISRQLSKNTQLVRRKVPKELKAANGRELELVSSAPIIEVIEYYAFDSNDISLNTKHQCQAVFRAFARRGFIAWVQDVLALPVDSTQANADINQLLSLYPGLQELINPEYSTSNEHYITARQYLLCVQGIDPDSPLFKWLHSRLPVYAAFTYRNLKQVEPITKLMPDGRGGMGKVNIYSIRDIPVLDQAYAYLLPTYEPVAVKLVYILG